MSYISIIQGLIRTFRSIMFYFIIIQIISTSISFIFFFLQLILTSCWLLILSILLYTSIKVFNYLLEDLPLPQCTVKSLTSFTL
jgi:hypothetical protein